jgi:hypothetical protein
MEPLISQARSLSSGTLSSLTGFSRYVQLDAIRVDWQEFCEENPHFENWQKAWQAFWPIYQTTQEFKRIKAMRFEDDPKPMPIEKVAERKAKMRNNKVKAEAPLLAATGAIPDDWLTTPAQEQARTIRQRREAAERLDWLQDETAKEELRAADLRERVRGMVDAETFAGYEQKVSAFKNNGAAYRLDFWHRTLARLDPTECPHYPDDHRVSKILGSKNCPVCLVEIATLQ